MKTLPAKLRIGTCSWNYPSWEGLVYTTRQKKAADYLPEYARRFRTVEIDSWFYRMPKREDAEDLVSKVDDDFRFTCKTVEELTLTHTRKRNGSVPVSRNENFLSPELFTRFLEAVAPMRPKLEAIMLEFEYLNRDKMPSLSQFLNQLEDFFKSIDRSTCVAIETRNKNFLTREYFELLKGYGVSHVFSEKLYMPPIVEVYERFSGYLAGPCIIRLLGGDRMVIEKKTGDNWNSIVEPKAEKPLIVDMVKDMLSAGRLVSINVNNHYEGSAPLTIAWLTDHLAEK